MERNNLLLKKDGGLGVFCRENLLLELKAGFLVESWEIEMGASLKHQFSLNIQEVLLMWILRKQFLRDKLSLFQMRELEVGHSMKELLVALEEIQKAN